MFRLPTELVSSSSAIDSTRSPSTPPDSSRLLSTRWIICVVHLSPVYISLALFLELLLLLLLPCSLRLPSISKDADVRCVFYICCTSHKYCALLLLWWLLMYGNSLWRNFDNCVETQEDIYILLERVKGRDTQRFNRQQTKRGHLWSLGI